MGRARHRGPTPCADPDAMLLAVSGTLLLRGLLARIRPHVAAVADVASLLAPVDGYLLVCPGLADAWDPDTDGGHALPPLGTAHLAALRIAGRRLVLRTAGLLHRLVTAAGHDPAGVLPELDRLIGLWCAEYRDVFGARWIPAARQAEYQTRVVLTVFELAARRAPVRSRSGESG